MENPFYMHACPMPPLILCQGTIHRRRHVTGEGKPVSTAGIFKEAFNSKSDVLPCTARPLLVSKRAQKSTIVILKSLKRNLSCRCICCHVNMAIVYRYYPLIASFPPFREPCRHVTILNTLWMLRGRNLRSSYACCTGVIRICWVVDGVIEYRSIGWKERQMCPNN